MKNKTGRRTGFTLMEILVAMVILVLVFGLLTLLYVRASKIRQTISTYNNVQDVLQQMLGLITIGQKNSTAVSLQNAANVRPWGALTLDRYTLICSDWTASNTSVYRIATDTSTVDTTMWTYDNGTWRTLDPNDRVTLAAGSKFEYVDYMGNPVVNPGSDNTVTMVKITLIGVSSSPSSPKVTISLQQAARMNNKFPY